MVLSGLPFTRLHGDLIRGIFNGQMKRQEGPHGAGFSKKFKKVNDWVQTAHIHTEKIKLQNNSCHKECTPGNMKLHVLNVKTLKQQLRINGCNQFPEVNARVITTGEKLPKDVIKNLLNANSIVIEKHLTFVTKVW